MAILGLQRPTDEPGAAWPAILVGAFAAFGGVLYGYDTGTIAGLQEMDYWQDTFNHPSGPELSLIVSIISVGEFFGALAAGQLADLAGRKYGIALSCLIPFNLGVILQTAATTQPTFIAGRFFAGLGVGLISVQVPMYQAETLPAWIRGFVIGSYQLCITIGLLLASLVSYGTQNRNDSGSYRIPIAIQFAWSLILMIGMLLLPETPRFLIKQDNHDKAIKSLQFLRRLPGDDPNLLSEYEEIKGNYEYEVSLGGASYLECFKGTIGKRTLTGIGLQCLQQLVGVNFIFYYGTSYFAGSQNLPNAFILSVITNVVNVVSTFPGLWAIDRFGRRPVLLVGALGMGISQYIVAACGAATSANNYASSCAQFTFICVFIFFFASTFGPGAWVVTGEMFPLKVRAKCLSMTTASNWFFNWLLSFIVPYLTGVNYANLGSNVFWIWGAFCWIAVVFVYFLVYETKNLSLEQVQELYENCSKAPKSKDYRVRQRRFSVEDGPKRQQSEKWNADDAEADFRNA